MLLAIPTNEFKERQQNFARIIAERGCDSAVIYAVADIFYLTGFHFYPTERPIILFVDKQQKYYLYVPSLEREHAEEYAVIDGVYDYLEYPSLTHPMVTFEAVLKQHHFEGQTVGCDAAGYGSSMGYRGPALAEVLTANYVSVKHIIEEMRFVKSPNEIELIKESCRWGNLAHRLLQKYAKAGYSEIEVTSRASAEATLAMIETLGQDYKPHGDVGAHAIFRGQIGPESAFPHAVTQNIILQQGDTLVTGAGATVFGYHSELERTMFVDEVSKDQEKYFQYMYEAQDVAFDNLKPGVTCSEVEQAVQNYFKEQGIQHLTRHHTGHNIGILGHEAPFLDVGDHTVIEPGMVFTIEPGIYVPGLGGFRHSDTVVITEDGMEMLTYYPRDLASLIC